MAAPGQPQDEAPATRTEVEALRRRIIYLETVLRDRGILPPPLPEVQPRLAPVQQPLPPPQPAAAPPAPQPVVFVPPGRTRPPREAGALERALGQRLAPRVGGLLVFLAGVFFLGVAIQRGWIGPIAQLGIAALGALALIGVGEVLTARRGYGTYPQILEGVGCALLYVTAFAAYALPYYREATGLSLEVGGLLMALVAAATIALALVRDARLIAFLGYALGFVTAGLGLGVLPSLTLGYVVILGTSLAIVVAVKRWAPEGFLGIVATGFFLVALGERPANEWFLAAWTVPLLAALPLLAFVAFTLRPPSPEAPATGVELFPFEAATAFLAAAWGATLAAQPLLPEAPVPGGVALALACVVAAALAAVAAFRPTARHVPAAYGIAAVLFYLLWPPLVWEGAREAALLTTLSYAAGAFLLAGLQRGVPELRGRDGLWMGAVALATAAAGRAVFADARLRLFFPGETVPDFPVASWQAWATLVAVGGALAILLGAREGGARPQVRLALFGVTVAFVGLWAFALFYTAFLTTLYLVLVGALLLVLAMTGSMSSGERTGIEKGAYAAALALLAAAALKSATYDAHYAEPRLHPALAAVESVVIAGLLLALYHFRKTREDAMPIADARLLGWSLIGGSALVLTSFAYGYLEGAAVSISLGLLGVLYLAAGFAIRDSPDYRYTGFALLGFVLLRVFVVDMESLDYALRALVFAVLGAILLGVGYVYTRMNRQAQ